jgi:hypothetical protein
MFCRKDKMKMKAKAWLTTGALLLATASPLVPQLAAQRHDRRDNRNQRAYDQNHRAYYDGMRSRVNDNRYDERYRRDEYEHRHDDGGIGPGKGALIGGAGGAALGALFGGGLKGALIGGAAGAGLGALGGKIAQDH